MPIVGGGATLFLGKYFLDIYAQKALAGDDQATLETSFPASPTVRQQFNSEWGREEYSVSLGYAVTGDFAFYAGYKLSDTAFEDVGEGTVTSLPPESQQSFTVDFSRKIDLVLDGPFIGGNYGYRIGDTGTIELNLAVASVDGEFDQITRISGVPEAIHSTTTGDAVATAIGLLWTAPLRILQGFNYTIGIDEYQYNFDGVEPAPGFSETLIRATVGVSYLFDARVIAATIK